MSFLRPSTMLGLITTWLSIASSLSSAQVTNQSAAQKISDKSDTLPKIMIFPWQMPGIDADLTRQTKSSRNMVTEKIKQNFLQNASALDKLLDPEKIPTALKDDVQNVWADQTTTSADALAIVPIWTHMHDHEFFGILVIDSFRNQISILKHKLILKERLTEAYKTKSTDNLFVSEFEPLIAQIDIKTSQKPPEELAVLIREQTSSQSPKEIDRQTLNTLLGYQLAIKGSSWNFTLLNPFAHELLKGIHKIQNLKNRMRKPNRLLFTRVTYQKNPFEIKLPAT